MLGLKKLSTKVFGSANERIVRQYLKRVEAINALEAETEKLSDDEIKARTDVFRA